MTRWTRMWIAPLAGFLRNERGATAIEYALIASAIATAIVATVYSLGGDVKTQLYDRIAALFG